jgi:hypothetical protein
VETFSVNVQPIPDDVKDAAEKKKWNNLKSFRILPVVYFYHSHLPDSCGTLPSAAHQKVEYTPPPQFVSHDWKIHQP